MKSVRSNIRTSLQEVRRIIYDLRPMALDDLGLVPTVKKHIKSMSEYAKFPIQLTIIGKEIPLEPNYEIAIFRLLQESLQNAINHANTEQIFVKLEFSSKQINLIVKDEGIGFDVNELKGKTDSFGLAGMKERVELLNGSIQFISKVNKGTSIIVNIPINKER